MKLKFYENTGTFLQVCASVLFLLEIVVEFIAFFILIFIEDGDLAWIGVITLFGGFIFTTVSTSMIGGFGELIEKAYEIERNTRGNGIVPKAQTNVDDNFEKYEKLLNVIYAGTDAKSIDEAINIFADFYIKNGKNIPDILYSNIENISLQTKYENLLKILEIGLNLTGVENVTNNLVEFYTSIGKTIPNDV